MTDVFDAVLILLLLLVCSHLGWWAQRWLKEDHRAPPSTESARTMAAMVVTVAALVLGLLVTGVKTDFDDHAGAYSRYGIALFAFDRRLRDYGPDAMPIRTTLRAYTAAVIADTWPDEPRPSGAYPFPVHPVMPGSDETAEFTALMSRMDGGAQDLAPADARHTRLATLLQEDVRDLESIRWSLVERARSKLSPVLLGVLVGWLAVVFLVSGLVSPRNRLTVAVLVLSAFSVASSLYLILDLDSAMGGFIAVPSRPLRDALWHMDQP
ncbi:hypothetical protein P7D22_15975 [Lichenihabitans sp. Uapishka_5]|uniref:bestrophin-like domain n=1 Tax=Lichenihabitans sp. Uapishka_5 TaxID=3037302 RepID=UPI0029E7DC43|nr:hypothetical protein [Lichenihabitans sp. Uapishka_5]MDX7952668.1 hypothetical protein [Lichenihabitans sp. Uapishka_5]